MNIKQGNAPTIKMSLKGDKNVSLTNLADTTGIIFLVKENKTDADADALITKAKTDMTWDTPSLGDLNIPLTSTDTDIPVGNYYYGVQLVYSATNQIEIELKDNTFNITQDIVRG